MNVLLLTMLMASAVPAQDGFLLWREDWKETPAEIPLSQSHVLNPDLTVRLYGPGAAGVKKSHHDSIPNDPYYVWSGACPGNWLISLRHKRGAVDLTGGSKVRWRSKQSGFRELRVAVLTGEKTWLVSSLSAAATPDWQISEIDLSRCRWRKLNLERITEEDWVENPRLDVVLEIGFTDLMPGGLSPACSRLDWIEVHGRWAK